MYFKKLKTEQRQVKIGSHKIKVYDPARKQSHFRQWLLLGLLLMTIGIAILFYGQNKSHIKAFNLEIKKFLFQSQTTPNLTVQPSQSSSSVETSQMRSKQAVTSQISQPVVTSTPVIILSDNQSVDKTEISPSTSQVQTLSVPKLETHLESLEITQTLVSQSALKSKEEKSVASLETLQASAAPPMIKNERSDQRSERRETTASFPITPSVKVEKPAFQSETSQPKIALVPETHYLPPQPVKKSQPTQIDQNKIQQLLQQCEVHFQADRLTTGRGGTAFECYQQVLAQAPDNREAKAGLLKIEARYQQWARQTFAKRNWTKARHYLNKIQEVNPKSEPFIPFEKIFQQQIETVLTQHQFMQAERHLAEFKQFHPRSTLWSQLKRKVSQTKQVQLTSLLKQCQIHFKANRLTSGQGRTALDCYHQVLALEPNNKQALAGLKDIEKRYQWWAERAFNRAQWQRVRRYLDRWHLVNPNSSELHALQHRLATHLESQQRPRKTTKTQSWPSRRTRSQPTRRKKSINQRVSSKRSTRSQQMTSQCSDILSQESLGIRPLTQKQKQFKQQHCR